MSVQESVKANVVTARTIGTNLSEFLDASCLAATSGYAIFEALQKNHKTIWYRLLLVAGLLIALQAFVMLVRHFNKPVVK